MSRIKIIQDNTSAGGGAVYGLGVIGALIYYFQHADTFMQFAVGLLKAITWPAFLVHAALTYLKI